MNKYSVSFSNGVETPAIYETIKEAWNYGNKIKSLYGMHFAIELSNEENN